MQLVGRHRLGLALGIQHFLEALDEPAIHLFVKGLLRNLALRLRLLGWQLGGWGDLGREGHGRGAVLFEHVDEVLVAPDAGRVPIVNLRMTRRLDDLRNDFTVAHLFVLVEVNVRGGRPPFA